MNVEDFRIFCLTAFKGVEESTPFGKDVLVMKVGNKMFTLINLAKPYFSINLKCEPNKATKLREKYEAIQPGYHMNKKHWNTISFEHSSLSTHLIKELTQHSYHLVFSSLSKKLQKEINSL